MVGATTSAEDGRHWWSGWGQTRAVTCQSGEWSSVSVAAVLTTPLQSPVTQQVQQSSSMPAYKSVLQGTDYRVSCVSPHLAIAIIAQSQRILGSGFMYQVPAELHKCRTRTRT